MKVQKKSIPWFILLISVLLIVTVTIEYKDWLASELFYEEKNPDKLIFEKLLAILGGIFVLFGLFLNDKRTNALLRSNQNQTIALQNDQFKNAVEHISSEKEQVILGGIEELIALANQNQNTDIILKILCSFIKAETRIGKTQNREYIVQQVINHIAESNCFKEKNVDLRDCDLTTYTISTKEIFNWNFSNSILFSRLNGARFRQCTFSNSKLDQFVYNDIMFDYCRASEKIYVTNGTFNDTSFYFDSGHFFFSNVNVSQSSFDGIRNSKFFQTTFKDTRFHRHIELSEFIGVNIQHANFNNLIIKHSYFIAINFEGLEGFENLFECKVLGYRQTFTTLTAPLEERLKDFMKYSSYKGDLDNFSSGWSNTEIRDLDEYRYRNIALNYNQTIDSKNLPIKSLLVVK